MGIMFVQLPSVSRRTTTVTIVPYRIPVWIINATYMGPVTLFLYYRYGRPTYASSDAESPSRDQGNLDKESHAEPTPAEQNFHDRHEQFTHSQHQSADSQSHGCAHDPSSNHAPAADEPSPTLSSNPSQDIEKQPHRTVNTSDAPHCHTPSSPRPFWATVLIGVSHCGAGCVLGDLVGEWLVYGTAASINGHKIW